MQVEPNKPVVLVDFTEYMNLLKIRDEYESIQKAPVSSEKTESTTLNSVEEDLNKGSASTIVMSRISQGNSFYLEYPDTPTHIYESNPYSFVTESKIKVRGIIEKLIAHPVIGPALKSIDKEVLESASQRWLPVVIYASLHENIASEVWVRMKEEFDAKFKPVTK